jgi:glutathione S-transferase
MQLLIGNKNYSSWSMRPWVLMRALGIPFDERKFRLSYDPESAFKKAIAAYTPAANVPVLVEDDGFAVWDTLAIAEYLHEKFPARGVWPADAKQRARARSIVAEMHSGFGALRNHCAMNIEARLGEAGARIWDSQPDVRQNVARIEAMWAEALQASGGPFLFGAFGAADAFYAPVCTRLVTYALPVSAATRAYVERVLAAPGVKAWVDDALAEHDFLAFAEPHRQP